MPRATVVIPIYERPDVLVPCLAALEATGLADLELVLVDNGSSDPGIGPILDAWESSAKVVRSPVNAGFASACNRGAREATTPFVVFLNSDTEVRPGWIDPLVESLEDPGVGIAASRLLYPDGRVQHAGMALGIGAQPVHLHKGAPGEHRVATQTRDVLLATGACLAISRELFAELGAFDLAFINGHEDADLCLRVAAHGRRTVYRGDSLVIHHESMSPGRLDHDTDNAKLFRRRWNRWEPDWELRLHEDGLDGGWADCRWEGPLLDDGPEAALGRASVRALAEEGRRPLAFEPDPAPLAPNAADLCDEALLTALNRLRVGAPAAETFRHLRPGRPLGAPSSLGPLIAVAGPGAVQGASVRHASAVLAAGRRALSSLVDAGVRPATIARLDEADPRPEAARRAVLGRTTPREGLAWVGPLLGRSGYAAAGRGMVDAADRIGLPLLTLIGDTVPEGLSPPRLPLQPQDFNPQIGVVHNPPVLPNGYELWADVRIVHGMDIVGATCFETEGIPAGWVGPCNAAREVWVPSAFNLRTFAEGGVDPDLLHAVPYPVDIDALRPVERERSAEEPVTFLSIFEWTWRKGWDVLLHAWAEEFAHDDPVRLVVVTYRGAGAASQASVYDQALGHLRAIGADPERIADLELVLDPVPHDGMPDLYRSADAFVLPTRGEGAGMPILEAAACGVPVIATAWGGHEELMERETSFPVELERMVEAPAALLVDNCLYEGLLLAEPSVASLRAQMRAVVDDRAAAAARGLAGRSLVEERFSVAATAAAMQARVEVLLGGPGGRVAR